MRWCSSFLFIVSFENLLFSKALLNSYSIFEQRNRDINIGTQSDLTLNFLQLRILSSYSVLSKIRCTVINTEITDADEDCKGLHLLSSLYVPHIVYMWELLIYFYNNPTRWWYYDTWNHRLLIQVSPMWIAILIFHAVKIIVTDYLFRLAMAQALY